MIRFSNVHKSFGSLKVFEGLSFEVETNRFVSVIGPSGTGKTTILRLITGAIRPDSGVVTVEGSIIGYVFQEPRLLPWKTAVDNVAIALRADGTGKREARDVARMWMGKLGLEDFEQYYPAQLSGGMKQRIAIARALVIKPNILLMDEPCSHLDADLKESLLEMIRGVFTQYRTTVVYVTHDLAEAVRLSDRVLRIVSVSAMQELDLSDREALIQDHVLGWLGNGRPAGSVLQRPLAGSESGSIGGS